MTNINFSNLRETINARYLKQMEKWQERRTGQRVEKPAEEKKKKSEATKDQQRNGMGEQ